MYRMFLILSLLFISTAAADDWDYLSMSGQICYCLENDPVRNRIFVGNMDGFHYLDEETGIWVDRDQPGEPGRSVFALDYSTENDQVVISGRETHNYRGYLEYSDDLGETGELVYQSMAGYVSDIIHDDFYVYACTAYYPDIQGEFLRSADSGLTWTAMNNHSHYFNTSMAIGLTGELYLAGNDGILRSWDNGDSWVMITGDLPMDGMVFDIATVYPAGDVWPEMDLLSASDLGLYRSTEEGVWNQLLPHNIHDVATFEGAPLMIVAITHGGRVLVSNDQGESFTDISGNLIGLDMVDAVVSPWHESVYIISTQAGVFRQEGQWASVDDQVEIRANLSLWPNPVCSNSEIALNLSTAEPISLRIFDSSGRAVRDLKQGLVGAGEHRFDWNGTDYSGRRVESGVYFIKMSTADKSWQTRATVLR